MRVLRELVLSTGLLVLVLLIVLKLHGPATPSARPDEQVARPPVVAAFEEPRFLAPAPVAVASAPPVHVETLPEYDEPEGGQAPQAVAASEPVPAAVPPTRSPTPAATLDWVRVTGTRVNLRAAPAIDGQWLASFEQGTRLVRLGQQGSWVEVRDPETGTSGWMSANYLEATAPVEGVASANGHAGTPGI